MSVTLLSSKGIPVQMDKVGRRPLVMKRVGRHDPRDIPGLACSYRHDDPRNTYRWASIDGVQDEVLGEELVVEGALSVALDSDGVYKQTVTGVDSYFQGDNADASATSVMEVLSGTPIGTKYLTSLYDLSGNGNHLTFDTDTEQPLYDPAAILTDGATQFGEVVIPEYLPNVQSNDDSAAVVYDIESVENEVLGEELFASPIFTVFSDNGNGTYTKTNSSFSGSIKIPNTYKGKILYTTFTISEVLTTDKVSGHFYESSFYESGDWITSPTEKEYSAYIKCVTDSTHIQIYAYNNFTGTISNISVKEVLSGTPQGTTTIKLGKSATGTLEEDTFKHLTAYKQTLLTARQASLDIWESYDDILTRDDALKAMQYYNPVALWVPGMQTDGMRYDEATGRTYLTQLTDLGLHGNHAVQDTDTAQAYLEGNSGSWKDAVFSGGQWYDSGLAEISRTITGTVSHDLQNATAFFANKSTSPRCVITSTGYITIASYAFGVDKAWLPGVTVNTPCSFIAEYTDNERSIYAFGNKDTSTYITNSSGNDMSGYLIGKPKDVDTQSLNGTISALALYNKTLTTHEQAVVNQCLNILGGD